MPPEDGYSVKSEDTTFALLGGPLKPVLLEEKQLEAGVYALARARVGAYAALLYLLWHDLGVSALRCTGSSILVSAGNPNKRR